MNKSLSWTLLNVLQHKKLQENSMNYNRLLYSFVGLFQIISMYHEKYLYNACVTRVGVICGPNVGVRISIVRLRRNDPDS